METVEHSVSGSTEVPEDKAQAAAKPAPLFLFIRHGQTTYNREGRLPGQLPGVMLTDEGRRQAQRAAVALSSLPLSAVISSPLERARDTAEIIARGWGLPVRCDPRLMDTDVGAWSGQKIEDLNKTDPRWKAFVEHPNQPPEGVESFEVVQARATSAIEEIRRDPSLGNYIVVVAHADVIKLILAKYTSMATERAQYILVGNASISVLAVPPEGQPALLALNWSSFPGWLMPPSQQSPATSTKPTTAGEAAATTAASSSVQNPL